MKAGLAAGLAVLALVAAPAAQASYWSATPKSVARTLVNKWNAPDGAPFVSASCRGRGRGRWRDGKHYYHHHWCGAYDDEDRLFTLSVTITGPHSERVTVRDCDDSKSQYYDCP